MTVIRYDKLRIRDDGAVYKFVVINIVLYQFKRIGRVYKDDIGTIEYYITNRLGKRRVDVPADDFYVFLQNVI